ncbi:hypothetical protein C8J57DRAFT_508750 [Mycena rebaudengoi]|nr:hypothetical protein C8J57DRAFT_508750 [Mycena rebaudengoi]
MLSAATKSSIVEVLGLVQKTVLNAASELDDAAEAQVARSVSEIHAARNERDEALKALATAQIVATKHEHEHAQMRATIETLQREVTHWKEQAKNWQDHYTRVEEARCGLSTELLPLLRSIKDSPPKHNADPPAAPVVIKRDSISSGQPPAYKSAMPPSPTETENSPLQSASTSLRNPRTPASKAAHRQQPIGSGSGRSELPPYQRSAEASSSANHRSTQMRNTAKASASTAKQVPQTPATAPPRQILVRRVQAVIHREVKEEDDDDDAYFEGAEEEEEEPRTDSVRPLLRRRRSMVIHDDESGSSGSEGGGQEREEESGDELHMNDHQEVYGGIHPVLPTPQTTLRQKRAANTPQQAEATPTKRRRVSDTTRAAKVPAKRK